MHASTPIRPEESAASGLSAMAVYLPPHRVDLQQWCDWTGNPWPKVRSVVGRSFRIPGADEDTYTMAASAVLRLIERNEVDPQRIGFLALATESSMDNSAGAVIVRGLVDRALAARGRPRLARECEVPEFKHACLAGVYGIKAALRYLAHDGADRQAIVVTSDIAEYERGSTGEQTQGAGAVAMLLEPQARLLALDLKASGGASSYRGLDFRKPFARFIDQGAADNGRLRDFPVFNGKYSTACYLDATLNAIDAMLAKRRGGARIDALRQLEAVFMHRPYHRMPASAWTLACLCALSHDGAGRAELAALCAQAGVNADAVLAEMRGLHARAWEADFDERLAEPFPQLAAVARVFREAPAHAWVERALSLGAQPMMEVGNLYSAAMPAWIAAGLEDALTNGRDLAGRELLLVGYGSGDAAEAIPARGVAGWQRAAARIGFADALAHADDLDRGAYEALHEGRASPQTPAARGSAFRIASVGRSRGEGLLQDFGVPRYELRR